MTLQIDNVTKRFGSYTAVDALSLTVQEGMMYGFLGANGAGKTTTFRMILGLLTPNEGQITWNNQPFSGEMRSEIGYLPEERGLYPKMKVTEQLLFLGELRHLSKKEARQSIDYWLERFGIPQYKDKKVEELSKGNQQKIQVIAALMHNPKLLILDEPFSGLDPVNVEMLKDAILDFQKKGATIIFSSHRMDHVEELCEALSIMHQGKQLLSGSLKQVKRSFGQLRVKVKADFSLDTLSMIEGAHLTAQTIEGAVFQVEKEEIAQHILQAALELGPIRHFEIEEPSLKDIFIAKVGETNA